MVHCLAGEETAPMPCPSRPSCTVLTELRSVLEVTGWHEAFCEAGGERCERRRLSREGAQVPDDLLPDGRLLVKLGELEEWATG